MNNFDQKPRYWIGTLVSFLIILASFITDRYYELPITVIITVAILAMGGINLIQFLLYKKRQKRR